MKVLFAGPTLHGMTAPGFRVPGTDILCRAPAQQGDILRAVLDGATAIGLVDGRYEDVAAPWHKEILYALSRGVEVLGGASMGALRAAECAAYGMVPVGRIAARYMSGDLVDDAAVAQLHGPPELGCPPLTEALVNIEATVDAAEQAGAVSWSAAEALRVGACRLFFKDRTYQAVARATGLDAASSDRMVSVLRAHRRDVKREDAIALIAILQGPVRRPDTASTAFVESSSWRRFVDIIEQRNMPMPPDEIDAAPPLARKELSNMQSPAHPYAVSSYVAEIAPQLAQMARSAKLSELAYLLGMAALQAKDTVKGWTEPR